MMGNLQRGVLVEDDRVPIFHLIRLSDLDPGTKGKVPKVSTGNQRRGAVTRRTKRSWGTNGPRSEQGCFCTTVQWLAGRNR